jgi:hypothetical protein
LYPSSGLDGLDGWMGRRMYEWFFNPLAKWLFPQFTHCQNDL